MPRRSPQNQPCPTSRHRGTILLSHDTGEVACPNPYLTQPFHTWIIRQAGDHFPGHKEWLPQVQLKCPQISTVGSWKHNPGKLSSLSGDDTFSSHFSFFDRQTASLPALNWGCCPRITSEFWMFQAELRSELTLVLPGTACSALSPSLVLGSCKAQLLDTWALPRALQTALGSDSTQARLAGTDGNAKCTKQAMLSSLEHLGNLKKIHCGQLSCSVFALEVRRWNSCSFT